eukprot:TRINITY_DN47894_c0_g1_i1.p1 TRINITY_DN47894_c0_g1~~TRINITY_DN47894_c0_g1_i1.p1  ORF type:complete len:271 (+),score=59.86 TRINITY_DN47894_c0_g1_i1:80-892(+)
MEAVASSSDDVDSLDFLREEICDKIYRRINRESMRACREVDKFIDNHMAQLPRELLKLNAREAVNLLASDLVLLSEGAARCGAKFSAAIATQDAASQTGPHQETKRFKSEEPRSVELGGAAPAAAARAVAAAGAMPLSMGYASKPAGASTPQGARLAAARAAKAQSSMGSAAAATSPLGQGMPWTSGALSPAASSLHDASSTASGVLEEKRAREQELLARNQQLDSLRSIIDAGAGKFETLPREARNSFVSAMPEASERLFTPLPRAAGQ